MQKAGFFLVAAFFVILLSGTARAQASGDFRSAATGNWNATATWETFNGATWVAPVTTPTSTNGVITIRNTHTVTVTANVTVDQVTVDAGGQITVNSTRSLTIANGPGTDMTLNGTVSTAGVINFADLSSMTVNSNLTIMSTGSITVSGGNGANRPTMTIASGGTVNNSGTLGISLGILVVNNTGTLNVLTGASFSVSSASTFTLDAGGTVSVDGTTTFGGGTVSTYNLNGLITLSGTLNMGSSESLTMNSGSTLTFTGSGTSSIANARVITISSGAMLIMAPNTTITGAGGFNLTSGASMQIGSTAGITSSAATGNIRVTGTRTFSSGANYTYNGTAAQITGVFTTSPTANTVANLTIDNAAGVTLSSNRTVTGILALTNGDLTTTGAFTLTQSGTSTGNGDVVGKVQRTDMSGGEKQFGNPNVRVTKGSDTFTTMTVNLIKNFAYPSSVKRTYELTPSVGGVDTSTKTVRLHYLEAERNGNAAATLQLLRGVITGSTTTWNGLGATDANYNPPAGADDNWVETTTTEFSPWAIGGPNAPTDIAMVGYGAAHSRDGKVLLQWETGREVNNLGFNIYREDAEKRVRVNKSLIVGSGLTARPGTVMSAGRSYAWMASAAQAKDTIFWIEEIDFSGRTVWHGPIQSQEAAGGLLTMSADQQAILEQTSTFSDLAEESENAGVTRPVESLANTAQPKTAKLAGAMTLTGAVIGPKPPINPANPTVKISLKQEGWYRIGQPQLVAAGFSPSVNPNAIQLFAGGAEIPISVTSNNGVFDSTSAIEFYGLGIDTPSTDTHVYSLTVGSKGLRIQNAQGQGGLPPSASFLYAVERKDRTIYASGIRNGDAENFFGSVVGSSPANQTITLKNVDSSALGQATIEVGMQGLSLTPHVVTVNLNGNPIGTISYDSQAQGVAQFTVPNSSLLEGQNLVTLAGQPAVLDISLVDHIRVSYWHSYAADGNALKFTATANQQVTLTGFTSANVSVFDVTNPNNPSKVEATVAAQKSSPTFVVTVAVPGTGTRTLLAIGDDQTRSPLSAIRDNITTWKSKSNAADLVIITHDSMRDSFKPLQALRQSQGLKVALVDAADLYDEFNNGNKSPQAIKDFLAYARANWKTAPRYVLLAGSASYDPKSYNGLGGYDLVPTKLIDTVFSETASDDWFADFNMDGIAEMAVGRLPVPSSEEAQTTVTKLAAYENGGSFNSSLLVADGNQDFDFEAANASLAALFPGSITVQQINRGQIGTAAARQQLLDGIASGQKIVNYVGHGSPTVWRDNLFTSADAAALTNTGRYPLFIAMTCLNGEFQLPQLNTLATALMNSRSGGSIAVWASSGFTVPSGQAVMNQQFYTLLFQSNRSVRGKSAQSAMTLGEITNSAKSSVSDPDIRRTWILFGDPSMRLR